MNQQRITTTQQIMENMKPTYLQRKEKCKMQNIISFIRLHKLNIQYEDVLGYYDFR